MLNIRIHGDNIVECERAWSLVRMAVFDSKNIRCRTFGPAISPCREIRGNGPRHIIVQFFPGFRRWAPSILDYVKERGAILRENADAIVSILWTDHLNDNLEIPVVAIEFCRALPAGNQAWQRLGRAYSLCKANIPYLFITEIGGFELDENRGERAMRFPNPVVPFAYVAQSLRSAVPSIPIFQPSSTITEEASKMFNEFFGERELIGLMRQFIYQKQYSDVVNSVVSKTIKLVNFLSEKRRGSDTFIEPTWEKWLESIKKGKNVVDFICSQNLPWSKVVYIRSLTKTAERIIRETSKYAVAVGASRVPICIIPKSRRTSFGNMIMEQHPDLPTKFRRWIFEDANLGVCWVMGFKPRGDDARPDRGLPPLARMLLGPNTDLLSFVYGPAKRVTWPLLRDNPTRLAAKNGLWESIMAMSDAVLIDSSTDSGITEKGYLRSHWGSYPSRATSKQFPAVNPRAIALGENDVDTVIHLLLSSEENESIFEGMCNPPGGDWSGISIIEFGVEPLELRWVSLPRVSASGSKRPDHVFEFSKKGSKAIILAIESKQHASSITSGIGDRLTRYVRELFSSPASAERNIPGGLWKKSNRRIKLSDYEFASAVGFLVKHKDEIKSTRDRTNVDLVFGVDLRKKGMWANVTILPCSTLGRKVSVVMKRTTERKELQLSANII